MNRAGLLNYIPAAAEITVPVTGVASIIRTALGNNGYEAVRQAGVWSYGALSGFIPLNPLLWPMQIAILFIVILILIFVFKVRTKYAILSGYIIQAIIVTFAASYLMDFILGVGFGV